MIRGYSNRMPVITRHPDAIRPQVSGNDRFGRTHARLIYPGDSNNNKRYNKKLKRTINVCVYLVYGLRRTAVMGQALWATDALCYRTIASSTNIINLTDKILNFFKQPRLIVYGNLLLEQISLEGAPCFLSWEQTNSTCIVNYINLFITKLYIDHIR